MSRAAIAAEAVALEPGESMRIVCPFCEGGSHNERCMSVKRDWETGLLLYVCFRGKCEESGVIGGQSGVVRTTKEKKEWRPYDTSQFISLNCVPDPGLRWMREMYLDERAVADERGWCFDPTTGRIAMAVHGPLRELRGYVLRSVSGQIPKVLSARLGLDYPFQSWEGPLGSHVHKSIICVEDIPSAVRVAEQGYWSVALLGNTPSDFALDEIASAHHPVVFALDPDATEQALRLARRYGLRGQATVLVLNKDFKNMTREEARECLASVT